MPDIQELSDGDMDVVERMKSLPDSVLFGEETEDTKAGQERSDDPEAPDEIRDGPETSQDEVVAEEENEPEAGAETPADPEFEVPNPDGGEARKVKLSELLAAETELTALKSDKDAIFQREEARVRDYVHHQVGQAEQWSRNVAMQLQAALQMVQPPTPPDIELRNPQSPKYDPDRYETEKFYFEQRSQSFRAAQGLAQQLSAQAEQIAEARREAHETAEADKLLRAWPTFADKQGNLSEEGRAFFDGMGKHYGTSMQELDNIITDHRQVVVARDALKWREHEAKQKAAKTSVKEKVAAKAPAKVAQSDAGKRNLSREQSDFMNARKAMKANGKDMNATARAFMKFV